MAVSVQKSGPEVVRWDPLADLNRLNQQLAGYLDHCRELASLPGGFNPFADVEETEDACVVEIELPGIKRDDVSVDVSGRPPRWSRACLRSGCPTLLRRGPRRIPISGGGD